MEKGRLGRDEMTMGRRGDRVTGRQGDRATGRVVVRHFADSPIHRIGLFGGTFNPIHIGHIKMAEAARKEYKLDYVYFIPCGIPPHKQKEKLFPAKKRYEWLQKSIKGKKYFKVLDIELKKKKKAYTIETIKKLRSKEYSLLVSNRSLLYFLIGADEFEKLCSWEKANKLTKLVHFLVLPRPSKRIKIPPIKNLKWSLVHTKPINISSSKVRERILKKKSIARLLPKEIICDFR